MALELIAELDHVARYGNAPFYLSSTICDKFILLNAEKLLP